MRKWMIVAVAGLALSVAGCKGGCQGESGGMIAKDGEFTTPEKGGRLVYSSIGEPSVLLPPLASDSASATITGLVFSTLVDIGKDLEVLPGLAERWEISEDGLVITFFMRKDATFHDGEPVTADDVMFTYQALMDPKTPSPYKTDFIDVTSFEKLDSHTVRITYGKPFAPALNSFAGAFGIMPQHLLEGTPLTESPLRFRPVGSGPYEFVSWDRGARVTLRANPRYFKGAPYITDYIMRIIPDQATIFLELRAGGLDQMSPTPVQYARQTDGRFFRENMRKFDYYGFGYTYLGFNHEDARFKDKRVRRAISMAINRDELVEGVLMGLGTAASGPYRPDVWYHNANVKPVVYDPDGARALLEEAGFKTVDGKVVQPDGELFSIEILTNQGNESRRKAVEIIQRRLAEIGIDVRLRVVEWSALLKEFIDKKRFETILLGWNSDTDPDQYPIWHSSETAEGHFNFISYRNPEVDELLVRGRMTVDRAERKKIYDRFQEILEEDQPYAFLFVPKSLVVIHRKVHGIDPGAAGLGWNFEQWWIPRVLQRKAVTPE